MTERVIMKMKLVDRTFSRESGGYAEVTVTCTWQSVYGVPYIYKGRSKAVGFDPKIGDTLLIAFEERHPGHMRHPRVLSATVTPLGEVKTPIQAVKPTSLTGAKPTKYNH